MVKFQIPEISSKTISTTTLKIYKSKLNLFAAAGVDSREKLLEPKNQKKVCRIVKELQNNNADARLYFSACFYVLADTPNEKKEIIYQEFQKYKDKIPTSE